MVACELCGREGQLYQARIEGTVMTVCESCKAYGEVIKRVPSAKEAESATKMRTKEREEYRTRVSAAPKGEVLLLVRPDYARVIKAARERLGLKQEEMAKRLRIKESQLHKLETGTHVPDIETARTLEKDLNIRLVMEHTETGEAKLLGGGSGPFTIGDMVKQKK
jgi:putative transcription factor